MRPKQGNKNGEKSPTFIKDNHNCLISKDMLNLAGLINMS
ncbi:hypothetical protein M123_4939 [Bacteroides fragilis str. 3976T8]|uniref:Uncharacterized protein n=1 Tax=Bacteroides fragilis str. 3976T8 TaxID=1339314 RepID=A0A016B2V0_BACFG|nr:hypothetical protein M123_4939 [Bacteroides fragilis str. 3976T8]